MKRAVASAALILAALVAPARADGADMACASEHEWKDLVVLGMGIADVRSIVDGPGDVGPVQTSGPHQGQYKVDWPCCPAWHPDKKVRGWFHAVQNILLDKNVIDA